MPPALRQVLNENRDFYADAAAGALPEHDVLLTNPPYSADHKQRLLSYLLAQRGAADGHGGGAADGKGDGAADGGGARAARPFLLLVPAWMAGTDYWAAFVAALADGRDSRGREAAGATTAGAAAAAADARAPPERRAGVFYVSPTERCAFRSPPPLSPRRHPRRHPRRRRPA